MARLPRALTEIFDRWLVGGGGRAKRKGFPAKRKRISRSNVRPFICPRMMCGVCESAVTGQFVPKPDAIGEISGQLPENAAFALHFRRDGDRVPKPGGRHCPPPVSPRIVTATINNRDIRSRREEFDDRSRPGNSSRFLAQPFWAPHFVSANAAFAQDACKNRGQLDTNYCDENNDLVADAPKDSKNWKDPSTLVFAYTPVEDPAVYANIFKPFTDYLATMHRQARGLLSGAVEFGRDRSDALGPPACRGLLDRPDRFRRQSRRRDSVRRQGHRERPARLSPALDREEATARTRSSPT